MRFQLFLLGSLVQLSNCLWLVVVGILASCHYLEFITDNFWIMALWSWISFVVLLVLVRNLQLYFECFYTYTVGWGTKAQCFCPPYLKTWFFYVVFNAELNGTIRILCFRCAIIDLLWHSRAHLGHSRSIMTQRKRKIMMVPFNSALKTT